MGFGAMSLVVALVVGGVVAAFLLPIAFPFLEGIDQGGWSTQAQALWSMTETVIVLSVFVFFAALGVRHG